jgi:ankyrin repeat protein
MHSTEALPLPPSPNVEQYRKLAKELLAAVKGGDAAAIHYWTKSWFARLMRLSGPDRQDRTGDGIENAARRFTAYWTGERKVKDIPPPRATLAHAQYIIARVQGFANWTELVRHIETIAHTDSAVGRFEAAVDAIVTGDIDTLQRLLREHPELATARSSRTHRCALLHYVSANGVEGYRQKTPPNIVAITKLLLVAGADVDAKAECYGKNDTALGLTATSVHPQNAGVMIPMLETLVNAGADLRSRDVGWGIIRACLANGQPDAARWLVQHGAHMNLEEAAGMGRLDVVKAFVTPDGTLLNGATRRQLVEGFKYACGYGRNAAVIRYLLEADVDAGVHGDDGSTGLHWAAYGGNAEVVELLLRHGAKADIRETTHGGKPLDWAMYAWGGEGRPEAESPAFHRIIAMLVNAGAKVDPSWFEANEARRRIGKRVAADPKMRAALRGEIV